MISRAIAWLSLVVVALVPAAASAGAPFQMPTHGHPEELVGDLDYTGPTALAFDSANRPYMMHLDHPEPYGHILTRRDGQWVERPYLEALKRAYPKATRPTSRRPHPYGSIAIDGADRLYAIVPVWVPGSDGPEVKTYALLYSTDFGESFEVFTPFGDAIGGDEPGRLSWPGAFLEIRTGHNGGERPPAIGYLEYRKDHSARWTAYKYLNVLLPKVRDGELELGEPIEVTEDSFGASMHSGGYSFAVTRGDKTHIVYAEIPEQSDRHNPTYAATLDRTTREVVDRTYLFDAPPDKPDVHSTPVIAADAEGYLHVMVGAHNNPFHYLKSKSAGTVAGEWTEPTSVGSGLTYATLAAADGAMHVVSRIHPRLTYRRRNPDGSWTSGQTLVEAPEGHSGYSVYYHRLFVDREGALYVTFTFWEKDHETAGEFPRALIVSEDGGETWQLVDAALFDARSDEAPEGGEDTGMGGADTGPGGDATTDTGGASGDTAVADTAPDTAGSADTGSREADTAGGATDTATDGGGATGGTSGDTTEGGCGMAGGRPNAGSLFAWFILVFAWGVGRARRV